MLDRSAVSVAFPELERLAFLAERGQKYVFRARRRDDEVVLKIFKAGQEQESIDREIEAVARLSCDYVPAFVGAGRRVIGGTTWPFLIEEFVAGESYRTVLKRQPMQSVRDVLRLGEALLRSCCDFEAQQMVHQDIKPENLILGAGDKVWVIDFGIVRLLQRTSTALTQQRYELFTPGYAAPELARNLKPKIDIRADLFSVGVVLYESLNGSNPYLAGKRNVSQVLQAVCSQDLPRLTIQGDKGARFAEFLGALTARFPSRRPSGASEALCWFQESVAGMETEL